MPYIKKIDVTKKPDGNPTHAPGFSHLTLRELGRACRCAGDLNYVLTQVVADYVTVGRGPGGKACGYEELSDAEKALHGALMEFCRRVLWPYENGKIAAAAVDNHIPEMNRPIDPLASVAKYAQSGVWPEFLVHEGEPKL